MSKVEQYRCPSYAEDGTVRDCLCGKCNLDTTHYKIKVLGIGKQWHADTFEEAKLLAGKVWMATRLDNIYIDEYYGDKPTGVWYRKEGMDYIINTVMTATA